MTLHLLHAADLHLSRKERAHGLEVLEELVHHCRRLEAQALLLSGDIFDTPADLEDMAPDALGYLGDLAPLPVLMIPGNHELAGGLDPAALPLPDTGALQLMRGRPFTLLRPAGLDLEVLGVPFQSSLSDFPDWAPPPRERRWRVGLLHGVVHGMSYTGESEESDHAVIDPLLFGRVGLHYAALGHIHARRERHFGDCLAHYPGSTRVWRRGETGPRAATLVTLDDAGVRTAPVVLKTSGQWRKLVLALDEAGALLEYDGPGALLESLQETCSGEDWVELRLDGLVEDHEQALALGRELRRRGEPLFRKLDVDDGGSIVTLQHLRGHPLVLAFDRHWKPLLQASVAAGASEEAELLRRARRMALEEINAHLELG